MRLRNIAWNLGGLGAPLIIGAFTVPSLIRLIGSERFGLLALAWGLIGFAGIFDLGIGRATTQSIAQLRGSNRLEQVPVVVRTAVTLCLWTGLAGALLLGIVIFAGAHTHIKYTQDLAGEVTLAAYFVAVAIPIQSLSAMYRGVNEAFENFRGISLVRIGLGVATFAGPFCVALFTTHLAALVSTLLLSRLVALFCFERLARSCLRRHTAGAQPSGSDQRSRAVAKQLLTFGGWVTVSSVAYPLMMQADRILIGSIVSAGAVASYAIPYEIVVQSLIVTGAITTVFFPRMSVLVSARQHDAMSQFNRWLIWTTLLMLLVAIALAAALPYILPLWLGESLQDESIKVGQILAIGLVPYAAGTMYVVLIHAHKRSDITAKSHLLEAPLYLALLYWMIQHHGLLGAAWAWVIRVSIDSCLLIAWHSFSRHRVRGAIT